MTKVGITYWYWLPVKLEAAMKMKNFPFFQNHFKKALLLKVLIAFIAWNTETWETDVSV